MIYVIGLGPGNKDYILPVATKTIQNVSMVIGAKRNLDAVREHCKEIMALSNGFETIGHYIKKHQLDQVAVVVSGDTGFHSMLAFVQRHVDQANIRTIPGISSLQYMYSRIGLSYEEAKWVSLHGRKADLTPYIKARTLLGILTDQDQNNRTVASLLEEAGCRDAQIYVGERLSYENEKISKLSLEECKSYQEDVLSVVVLVYEKVEEEK